MRVPEKILSASYGIICYDKRIELKQGGKGLESIDSLSLSLLGYNRKQVRQTFALYDNRLQELESRIQTLESELAEKDQALESYQDKERALTEGIVDARKKGEEILQASQIQAEEKQRQVQEQIIQYKEDFSYHSRDLVRSGSQLKTELKAMKEKMQLILDQYQDLMDETDFDSLFPGESVDRFSEQIEAYNQDPDISRGGRSHYRQDTTITEAERRELERLIHDVLSNEGQERPQSAAKLVDFKSMGL